jgi:hypothetical protein
MANSLTTRQASKSRAIRLSNEAEGGSASPEAAWGVQLIGSPLQGTALASFEQLQRKYKSILGDRQPLILRSKVGTSAFWYRVRIAADSRRDAEKLCSSLRAVLVAVSSNEIEKPTVSMEAQEPTSQLRRCRPFSLAFYESLRLRVVGILEGRLSLRCNARKRDSNRSHWRLAFGGG